MPQDRQLAAIMFTDIVGYTTLMGKDEEAAFTVLNKNRALQKPIIEKHRGRLLKEIGDGILASFNSASDAVYCALEIQQNTQAHSDLSLRIGVHIGDVVFEGEDVFGDGVNIASRIQESAPVGGVLVSEAVQKNVSNKKGIVAEYFEEKQLRGVQEPVKTYLLKTDSRKIDQKEIVHDLKPFSKPLAKRARLNSKLLWALIAVVLLGLGYFAFQGKSYFNTPSSNFDNETTASSINLETSIAVLPFDNFSAEKDENQHLCDGIMEEIINHLAKIESLVVRSRSSVEQYREDRPSTVVIGDQLGISYLLEGSVQVVGDELKVVVQLIEVAGDRHIWQESYIQPLENIFKMYEDIAQQIAGQLEIRLSPADVQRLSRASTDNLIAYELALKANQSYYAWGINRQKRLYLNTIDNLQKAEKLDPGFAEVISHRAGLYFSAQYDYPEEVRLDSVLILANRALAIDSKSPHAYLTRANYYKQTGESNKALLDLQKAYELSANDGTVNANLGNAHFENGNYIYGLQLIDRAIKLKNGNQSLFWHYHNLGFKYLELYDKEEALNQWNKMLAIEPEHSVALFSVAYIETPNTGQELFKKIISLDDQSHTMALVALGRLYALEKQFENALEYFAKVEGDTAMYVEWNLERYANEGLALWHSGQKQKGEQLIKKALEGYLKINPQTTYFCDREIRLAGIQAFLGNRPEAYQWLKQSKWTKAALFDVQQDVWFSNINQEDDFKEIVNQAMLEKKKIRNQIASLKAEGEWEI
jgi:class 3 adenylate cyclase/TolB-like protein/Tfp pilus assembly protein PilF